MGERLRSAPLPDRLYSAARRHARRWLPALLLVGLFGCASAQEHRLRRGSLARVPAETERAAEATAASLLPCVVRIRTWIGEKHGVIVRPEGLVLTCAHGSFVPGTSEEVLFADGSTGRAEVLGEDRDGDLLALRIVDPPGPYPAAPLAENVRAGEWAFLATLGAGARALSLAAGRVLYVDLAGAIGPDDEYRNPMLVIDAPAFAGDSGAPAINERGEIVGIASRAAITEEISVLFAGSIHQVRKVLSDLAAGEDAPTTDEVQERLEAFFASLYRNARARWEGPGEPDAAFLDRHRVCCERVVRRLREQWKGAAEFTSEMTKDGLRAIREELRSTP